MERNERLMNFFRRHKQSITLLAIAAVLLVIAFYISQQTRSNERESGLTFSPQMDNNTLSSMPDCTGLNSVLEELSCYAEAAQVSEAWVLALADELSLMEPDPARQVAFIETQIAWEGARDAECEYIRGTVDDAENAVLQELRCITDQNLDRLARLERYRDEWYCEEDCDFEAEASD
jgi:uncharacterized protein YecT (DUF1311 family)